MRSPQSPLVSVARIVLVSLLTSCSVLLASLLIQWLIYDDWLHQTGPLRIVGTSIAAVITFAVMLRWQWSIVERQRDMMRRFEMISQMNDRIRNALQKIECVTYVSKSEATETVRQEVDAIDRVLRNLWSDVDLSSHEGNEKHAARKSA